MCGIIKSTNVYFSDLKTENSYLLKILEMTRKLIMCKIFLLKTLCTQNGLKRCHSALKYINTVRKNVQMCKCNISKIFLIKICTYFARFLARIMAQKVHVKQLKFCT